MAETAAGPFWAGRASRTRDPRTRDEPGPGGGQRHEPAAPDRTYRWTLAFWTTATVATLGMVVLVSAALLSHYLVVRADEEIEKFHGLPITTAAEGHALVDTCLLLVLDGRGHVVQRYAGDPGMPAFPELTPEQLDDYAAQDRPRAFSSSFRALVERVEPSTAHPEARYLVHARSMSDTHETVLRLVQAEVVLALPVLVLVVYGARRLGRRAARERAESEQRLREFLCAAGHELRNPLTTISGYAELARAGDPAYEAMRQEALGRVATEVRRMGSLIDELVFLSRLDLGQPLELRCVDLAQLCRDAVDAERDCHPERPIRLLVAPGEHTVTGDPLRLHQVVANLLTNARVHTPEGTTTTLGVGTEDGHRVIEVTDDGPGVPDELRVRIFDRFVRGEEPKAAGSGLGLSIVSAIAAAHGGSVTLEPSDRGAWFRVRIPAPY